MYAKKTKKKKKKYVKKKTEINATKKKTTKTDNQKIQQKRRGDKKEWVKGEEEPTEKNICPVFLSGSFSFLFMKLYMNVYQIKTMCRIQLWLHFLYLFRVMAR